MLAESIYQLSAASYLLRIGPAIRHAGLLSSPAVTKRITGVKHVSAGLDVVHWSYNDVRYTKPFASLEAGIQTELATGLPGLRINPGTT